MGRFSCVLCGSTCSRSCFHKHQDQYGCHNRDCPLHAPGTTVVDDSTGEKTDWYSYSSRHHAGSSSDSSSDGPSSSVRYVYFESSGSDSDYDCDSDAAFSDGGEASGVPPRAKHTHQPASSKDHAKRPKEHRRRGTDADPSRSSGRHHARRERPRRQEHCCGPTYQGHPEPHPGFAPRGQSPPYVPVSGYGYVPPPPGASYQPRPHQRPDYGYQVPPPQPDPRFFAHAPQPDPRFFAPAPHPDPRFYAQMPPGPRYYGFVPGGAPAYGDPRNGQGHQQQQQGQKPKEPFRYQYAGTEEPDSDDGKKQKK